MPGLRLTRPGLNNSNLRIKVERSSEQGELGRTLKSTALAFQCAVLAVMGGLAAQGQSALQLAAISAGGLAATPPMGWNSLDGYGTTIKESEFKANAEWLAKNLRPYGWEYAVVDMEWFVSNPTPEGNSKNSLYTIDS